MSIRRRVGRLQVVAGLAGAGDVVTTAVGLQWAGGAELNVVLARLEVGGVPPMLAALAGFVALLVAVSVYGGPWERRVAGWYLVLAMGFGTVNNLLLIATGGSVLGALGHGVGTWLIAYGIPLAGLGVGTALTVRAEELPVRRAGWLSTLVLAAMVVLPVLAGEPAIRPG